MDSVQNMCGVCYECQGVRRCACSESLCASCYRKTLSMDQAPECPFCRRTTRIPLCSNPDKHAINIVKKSAQLQSMSRTQMKQFMHELQFYLHAPPIVPKHFLFDQYQTLIDTLFFDYDDEEQMEQKVKKLVHFSKYAHEKNTMKKNNEFQLRMVCAMIINKNMASNQNMWPLIYYERRRITEKHNLPFTTRTYRQSVRNVKKKIQHTLSRMVASISSSSSTA